MKKIILTAAASLASLAIATPALAADTSMTDPTGDVLETFGSYASVGYYAGDITGATVSYDESQVTVTTTFADLESYSLNTFFVSLDVNGDGADDFIAASTRSSPILGTGDRIESIATSTIVGTPAVTYTYGLSGSISMSFPASIIGTPASLQAQILAGYSLASGGYLNLDAIPQDAYGNLTWSPAVANTITPVVAPPSVPAATPSAPAATPAPTTPSTVVLHKAVSTKTSAQMTAHTQKYKGNPVKIAVRVEAAGEATGKVTIFDGSKKLKTVALKHERARVALPRSLKIGVHKISVKYTPANSDRYNASGSSVYKVKVVK